MSRVADLSEDELVELVEAAVARALDRRGCRCHPPSDGRPVASVEKPGAGREGRGTVCRPRARGGARGRGRAEDDVVVTDTDRAAARAVARRLGLVVKEST